MIATIETGVILLSSNFHPYTNNAKKINSMFIIHRELSSTKLYQFQFLCFFDSIVVIYSSRIFYYFPSSFTFEHKNHDHLFPCLQPCLTMFSCLGLRFIIKRRKKKGKMQKNTGVLMNHLKCINKMQCLRSGPFRTFSLLLFLEYTHVEWMLFLSKSFS